MPHNPIFGSDPAKPESSASASSSPGQVESGGWSAAGTEGGSDLGELAARFAAHGGGRVSQELSADLALEIVLNEIVEQACLATGASGAAIVLERGGEWVCRASAGGNAPQLGARLDTEAGLSGACVKTRTVQRCDDAQNDTRADIEACRILGVRSVIILPLRQKSGEVAGVFEVFSSLPSAFGERDERTLGALSQRVLRNLERAAEPMPAAVEPSTRIARALAQDITGVYTRTAAAASADTTTPSSDAATDANQGSLHRLQPRAEGQAVSSRGMNLLTWALAAAVLAYTVLLSVLVAKRLGGGRAARAHAAAPGTPSGNQSAGRRSSSTVPPASVTGAGSSGVAAHATAKSLPPGSLLVYENGKEVFRMPPAAQEGPAVFPKDANGGASPSADGPGMQRASEVEPAGMIDVSPEVAEASLLHRVEPDYPDEALRQQIQGPVELDVRTGRDGAVREVKLLSGQRLLADAAIAAVEQWRFTPRVVEGQAVEMQTKVTLNFRLPH